MVVSNEIRRLISMPRDSKSMTDLVDYFDELTTDQRARARLIVCANAIGDGPEAMVTDALEMMRMLGIAPDSPPEDYLLAPAPLPNMPSGYSA
jgi:hypothetical protein